MNEHFLQQITVPVTNPMSKEELAPFLARFNAQGLPIGISKKWGKYEIWRGPLEDETLRVHKNNTRNQVIENRPSYLLSRDFVQVYQGGALVWEKPRKMKGQAV